MSGSGMGPFWRQKKIHKTEDKDKDGVRPSRCMGERTLDPTCHPEKAIVADRGNSEENKFPGLHVGPLTRTDKFTTMNPERTMETDQPVVQGSSMSAKADNDCRIEENFVHKIAGKVNSVERSEIYRSSAGGTEQGRIIWDFVGTFV
jgi:hypothetical protein